MQQNCDETNRNNLNSSSKKFNSDDVQYFISIDGSEFQSEFSTSMQSFSSIAQRTVNEASGRYSVDNADSTFNITDCRREFRY